MANEIVPFVFEGLEVRTSGTADYPLFCLVDVCAVLGLSQPSRVLERVKPDGVTSIKVIDTLGREQLANFIDEPNLYRVIFQSRKPNAERFQDWVFEDVLPAIRKTGKYDPGKLTEDQVVSLCVLSFPAVHVTRFEPVYYENLSRLTGLDSEGHKRPRWWAQLTKEWVYDCLPKGVTDALYKCRAENGGWEKLHQYLSDDGIQVFKRHMEELLRMMSYAGSVNDVRRMLNQKLKQHYQAELFEDCRKDGKLSISRRLKGEAS